ncbi:MAG: response regulator [Alphaproteobacteria bacterium]|nr:MAG: response regulator [Alphaproteobacteria bacterium]
MRLLLVEDDENKRLRLEDFVQQRFSSLELLSAGSLMSGVRIAQERRPDLVLLDMTLPNYDVVDGEASGGMHPFGGVEFLKQIKRLKIPARVVVVTQFETFGQPPNVKDFDELDREMRASFSPTYLGAVYYHASLEDWTEKLFDLIELKGGLT